MTRPTSLQNRWLGLALVAAFACNDSQPSDPTLVYDFAHAVALAEARREVDGITFGRLDAHPHLLEGFGLDQRAEDGSTWVMAEGERSLMRFFMARPRELEVELDCAAVRYPGSLAQEIVVRLNGQPVATFGVSKQRHQYRFSLPEDAALAGDNILEFSYPKRAIPDPARMAQAGHALNVIPDAPVSVILYAMRFDPDSHSGPAAGTEGDRLGVTFELTGELSIPFGTRLDYHLVAPAAARFEFASVKSTPEGVGELQILVSASDGRDLFALDVAAAGEPLDVALSPAAPAAGSGQQLLRVSLLARARPGEDRVGRVLIAAPQLRVRGVGLETLARLPDDPPNVLIYLADTLRRDHLGAYGYPRPVSPQIDRLASDAIVFDNAVAQSSWTRPAVVSLFTGLNPRRHGVTNTYLGLPDQAVTLAEAFRARGYETAAITENSHVSTTFGVDQGFRHFIESRRSARDAEQIHAEHGEPQGWQHSHEELDLVHELAFAFLHERETDRPFFLYLHTMDPHNPYKPLERYRSALAPQVSLSKQASYASLEEIERGEVSAAVVDDLLALYDAEIASNDYRFGAVLGELRARDLYDETLIVFLSDHGEAFNERGRLGHAHDLHSETHRIPLIVKLPLSWKSSGRRVDALVSQVDVFATLLDVLGIDLGKTGDGYSFEPLLRGGERDERPAFAHLDVVGSPPHDSVIEGAWKLIHSRSDERPDGFELYDRLGDPTESVDVAGQHPEVVRRLRGVLEAQENRVPDWTVYEAEIDERMLLQLQALGYAN